MKRETIAPASIQYFPLAQLYVSDMNPRQDADQEGIDLLADSLAMIGLIQNLSGILDGEGRVGIVAGGRRLRAIARAVERDATVTERHPELASVPVRIAPDEATARLWAVAENTARAGLHIADGSAISANLGVNPSLTITAQAERAMALWPRRM